MSATSSVKKRKVDIEHRAFNPAWNGEYFFIERYCQVQCLIYNYGWRLWPFLTTRYCVPVMRFPTSLLAGRSHSRMDASSRSASLLRWTPSVLSSVLSLRAWTFRPAPFVVASRRCQTTPSLLVHKHQAVNVNSIKNKLIKEWFYLAFVISIQTNSNNSFLYNKQWMNTGFVTITPHSTTISKIRHD